MSTSDPKPLKLGLIGYPLEHSLSPVLHSFLMEQVGVLGEYRCYPTPPEQLDKALEQIKAEGLTGFNVTIPYKITILDWLDNTTEEVKLIRAVNTIAIGDGQLLGHNTDIIGFLDSLPQTIKSTLPHRPALLIGAGGAARAIMAALIKCHVPVITLAVRNPEKAMETINLGRKLIRLYNVPSGLGIVDLDTLKNMNNYQLVINATPIGMPNTPESAKESPLSIEQLQTLPEDAYVYDAVYGPEQTTLTHHCKELNISAQDGLSMLVRQAATALGLWSGREISETIIQATQDHLRSHIQTYA